MIGLKSLNFLNIWEQRKRNRLKYLPTRERNKVERIDIKINNGYTNSNSSYRSNNTSR